MNHIINFRSNALSCFEAGVAMQKQTDAFRGRGRASSGQQEVGHEGVDSRSGVFSLCSIFVPVGSGLSRFSRWSRRLPL